MQQQQLVVLALVNVLSFALTLPVFLLRSFGLSRLAARRDESASCRIMPEFETYRIQHRGFHPNWQREVLGNIVLKVVLSLS